MMAEGRTWCRISQDMTAEHQRLREQAESRAPWMRWGPYVSERQWGTGARGLQRRWRCLGLLSPMSMPAAGLPRGEDGLAGFSDDKQRVCLTLALWNETRPDPEGAPFWPGQWRRQSRRGCEGALPLSGCDADAFVFEDALPVSAACVFPYQQLLDETASATARRRSMTAGHGHL